jgi:hypothetical protein
MNQIIFEYFKVSNNKLNHFKNKLVNLIEIDNSNIKFHHFSIITLKIPLNRNYDSWFNILKGTIFYIEKENNITNFSYIKYNKIIFEFKDYIFIT